MERADRLRIGDVIHDCDNRELRGLVVDTRPGKWGVDKIVWVQTSEDIATRRIGEQTTLLITRGS